MCVGVGTLLGAIGSMVRASELVPVLVVLG